jgi:O-antigen ligase
MRFPVQAPRGQAALQAGVLSRAMWLPGGLAALLLITIDGAIAYTLSPRIALGLPLLIVATALVIAATVCLFYRPMVGVYAAVLCVPAEALNLSFGSFGLTPTKAILVLLGGVVLVRFLVTGRTSKAHPAYVAFLAGQVITILGLLVARDTFVVIKLWVIWSALVAVSMLVASANVRQVKTIFYCLSVAGPILAVESIAAGGQQTLINGGVRVTDRAQGSFTHPAELAFWLLLALAPTLVLALVSKARMRVFLLAAAGLSLAGLLLTLTRGAIIGFAGSLLVLLAWRRFRRFTLLLLLIAGLYTVANFNAISRSRELSVIATRLSTVAQGAQTGGQRLKIWATTPQIIADHPLLGVGAGNFPKVSLEYGLSEGGFPFEHAHDVMLTIAAERGLGGLAMLIWFLAAVGLTGLAALRRRHSQLYPYVLGLCAALFGLFIDSLVDYPPGQDAVMATLMIEVGALIALERHTRRARPPSLSTSAPGGPHLRGA